MEIQRSLPAPLLSVGMSVLFQTLDSENHTSEVSAVCSLMMVEIESSLMTGYFMYFLRLLAGSGFRVVHGDAQERD